MWRRVDDVCRFEFLENVGGRGGGGRVGVGSGGKDNGVGGGGGGLQFIVGLIGP